MPRLSRLFAGAAAFVPLILGGATQPDRAPHVARSILADSAAGEWYAKGKDPRWHSRFLLHLVLQQAADSVWGTYEFEVDRVTVVPLDDIYGHLRGNKIELEDRHLRFWLGGTLRNERLEGRIANGSRDRAEAMTILFTRTPPR